MPHSGQCSSSSRWSVCTPRTPTSTSATEVVALLLTLTASVPYYFRRHAPLPVLLISNLVAETVPTTQRLPDRRVTLTDPPRRRLHGRRVVLIGATSDRRRCCVVSSIVVAASEVPSLDGVGTAFNFAIYAAAFAFGTAVRNRRMYTTQVEARAAASSVRRTRKPGAWSPTSDCASPRSSRRRGLLDGVIVVQAGVGAHVIDTDPAEAKKSLEASRHTSRATLTEIRRMLGVLRDDEGVMYAPAPSLADIDRLVRDVWRGGSRGRRALRRCSRTAPTRGRLRARTALCRTPPPTSSSTPARRTRSVLIGY